MPENNEKEPQYKSILSDDDGTAPRPIRKKQRDPMAEVRREIEEQQRQQQGCHARIGFHAGHLLAGCFDPV